MKVFQNNLRLNSTIEESVMINPKIQGLLYYT